MRRRTLLAAALVAAVVACTQVNQEVAPSPVTVGTLSSSPTTTPETGPGPLGTITLDPPQFTVGVGKNVNVQVTVKNSAGQEVTSENISANIIDQSVVEFVDVTDRTIQFGGLATGTTSIIISASGLQTATTGTVIP